MYLYSRTMRVCMMRTASVRMPSRVGGQTRAPAPSGTWAVKRATTHPLAQPVPSTPVTLPRNRCTTSPGAPPSSARLTSVPLRVCQHTPKLISLSWKHSHCHTSVTIVHLWWWAFSDREPLVVVRYLCNTINNVRPRLIDCFAFCPIVGRFLEKIQLKQQICMC